MTKRLLAAAAAALLALPALAEDAGREARLAVAKEYIEATTADMDMPRLLEQMYIPLIQQVEANGQTVTPAQRAELQALYEREMMEPMRQIMLAQDEVMADLMTMAEITAIRDFYNTEEGRSVMMKLPDLLAAQQPMVLGLVGEKIPQMMPEIQTILGLR